MKGTIYLWVLAAVLSGAIVGLLGFVVEGVFSLQSSVMEPVIIAGWENVDSPISFYLAGTIELYKGKPEIKITSKDQLVFE